MVINDNEHMSNHSAISWPVSAKTGNFLVLGPKMAEIQNLLKIHSKPKKSAQNKYEHEPHKCPQKSCPNHATSA